MVTHYCHEDDDSVHEPCLVEIFEQYISLVSELPKIDESAYKFENAPIGIHKLNSIVPFLMKEAGHEVQTAHCLRVTTATNLFRVYQSVLGRVYQRMCRLLAIVLSHSRSLKKMKSLIFLTRNLISFSVNWTGLKLIKRCSNILLPNSLVCRTVHSLTVLLTFCLLEISNIK